MNPTDLLPHIAPHAPLAYMGAGADLSLISAVIGLVLTLGSSFFFLLLWPIRTLLRKLRLTRSPQQTEISPNDGDDATPTETSIPMPPEQAAPHRRHAA